MLLYCSLSVTERNKELLLNSSLADIQIRFLLSLTFCLLFRPLVASSETVNLLDIPMNDGSMFSYIIEQPKKCTFEGVTEVTSPALIKAEHKKTIIGKIDYIQKKINLEIEKVNIQPKQITFSLKGAENMFFEFYFRGKKNCKLIKVIHYNEKALAIKSIDIDYNTFLQSPVLEKMTITPGSPKAKEVFFYPWAFRGQVSLYELNVGPAINVHTNIRINDQNKFNKNNPVVEPIPAFLFRYGPLFINKSGLGSLLYNNDDFTILGMSILEGEPYKGIGLKERKTGVFLGTILKYNLIELTYYNDFFNKRGYNFKLNLAPEFYYHLDWKITPQFFIQYWDNRYVDYYFGVNQAEVASSGFKTYQGTHTLNYGSMIEFMHFKEKWTFVSDIGFKAYGKEVLNSPTVTRDKEIRFITSVLYKFF
jgi:hypothetical protein